MTTEDDVRRICLSLPQAWEKPYAGRPGFYGHPAVLVHLEALDAGELREILTESWPICAPAKLAAAFDPQMAGQGL